MWTHHHTEELEHHYLPKGPPEARRNHVRSAGLARLYGAAVTLNKQNILDLVSDRAYADLCDLGCDDGAWTAELAVRSHSSRVFGVEVVPERAQLARSRGVTVSVAD